MVSGIDEKLGFDKDGRPVSGEEFLQQLEEWEKENPPSPEADREPADQHPRPQ